MQRIGRNIPMAALLFVLLALCSLPSLALQPVEEFVTGARKRNPDELDARANLAQPRYQAGTAAALDVDRARADVEQQVQQLANAELQVALAARALESASGVQPDVSTVAPLSDDLHPEPELETFATGLGRLPAVAAASASTRAAVQEADAQRLALVPSIAGTFTERGTNAPGFSGRDW